MRTTSEKKAIQKTKFLKHRAMNEPSMIETIRTLYNLLTPKGQEKIRGEINRNKPKTHNELYREIKARIDIKYPNKKSPQRQGL